MIYIAKISARKEGAIGTHGTERRTYEVVAMSHDEAVLNAINAAYQEGGLEHIRVHSVRPKGDNE